MGCDIGGDRIPNYQPGNNFSILINTDTKEETDRLFNGLSEGGKITMPFNNTFWGEYFGMFTDKFGINWMVSFAANKQKELQ